MHDLGAVSKVYSCFEIEMGFTLIDVTSTNPIPLHTLAWKVSIAAVETSSALKVI